MSGGILPPALVPRLMSPLVIVPEFGSESRAALVSVPVAALGFPDLNSGADHGSLLPMSSGSSN